MLEYLRLEADITFDTSFHSEPPEHIGKLVHLFLCGRFDGFLCFGVRVGD